VFQTFDSDLPGPLTKPHDCPIPGLRGLGPTVPGRRASLPWGGPANTFTPPPTPPSSFFLFPPFFLGDVIEQTLWPRSVQGSGFFPAVSPNGTIRGIVFPPGCWFGGRSKFFFPLIFQKGLAPDFAAPPTHQGAYGPSRPPVCHSAVFPFLPGVFSIRQSTFDFFPNQHEPSGVCSPGSRDRPHPAPPFLIFSEVVTHCEIFRLGLVFSPLFLAWLDAASLHLWVDSTLPFPLFFCGRLTPA